MVSWCETKSDIHHYTATRYILHRVQPENLILPIPTKFRDHNIICVRFLIQWKLTITSISIPSYITGANTLLCAHLHGKGE